MILKKYNIKHKIIILIYAYIILCFEEYKTLSKFNFVILASINFVESAAIKTEH